MSDGKTTKHVLDPTLSPQQHGTAVIKLQNYISHRSKSKNKKFMKPLKRMDYIIFNLIADDTNFNNHLVKELNNLEKSWKQGPDESEQGCDNIQHNECCYLGKMKVKGKRLMEGNEQVLHRGVNKKDCKFSTKPVSSQILDSFKKDIRQITNESFTK